MWRFLLVIFPLIVSFHAQALTFKSGGGISGEDASQNAPITEEAIAACQTEYFKESASDTMQVMSFNVRYDNPGDGKNNWKFRAPKVASMFAKHDVDLGGLQEVLHNQFEWLQKSLPDYEFIGVGRDDGKTEGEYAPIFFRKSEFELIKSDTVWLSETPEEPGSKGWDAALPRIITFALLRHKASDTELLLGSAHYDHRGTTAKRKSGEVIHNYINQQLAQMKLPLLVLTGDFNDTPRTATTRAIENKNCLFDARRLAKDSAGPNSTWNGFRSVAGHQRIDYVFVNPVVPVETHIIDDSRIENRFPSDHLPVIVSLGVPQSLK